MKKYDVYAICGNDEYLCESFSNKKKAIEYAKWQHKRDVNNNEVYNTYVVRDTSDTYWCVDGAIIFAIGNI